MKASEEICIISMEANGEANGEVVTNWRSCDGLLFVSAVPNVVCWYCNHI